MLFDLRYALRLLLKSSAFSAMTVLRLTEQHMAVSYWRLPRLLDDLYTGHVPRVGPAVRRVLTLKDVSEQ